MKKVKGFKKLTVLAMSALVTMTVAMPTGALAAAPDHNWKHANDPYSDGYYDDIGDGYYQYGHDGYYDNHGSGKDNINNAHNKGNAEFYVTRGFMPVKDYSITLTGLKANGKSVITKTITTNWYGHAYASGMDTTYKWSYEVGNETYHIAFEQGRYYGAWIMLGGQNDKDDQIPADDENLEPEDNKDEEIVPGDDDQNKDEEVVPGEDDQNKDEEVVPGDNDQDKDEEIVPGDNDQDKDEDVVPGDEDQNKDEDVVPGDDDQNKYEDVIPGDDDQNKDEDVVPGDDDQNKDEDVIPGDDDQNKDEEVVPGDDDQDKETKEDEIVPEVQDDVKEEDINDETADEEKASDSDVQEEGNKDEVVNEDKEEEKEDKASDAEETETATVIESYKGEKADDAKEEEKDVQSAGAMIDTSTPADPGSTGGQGSAGGTGASGNSTMNYSEMVAENDDTMMIEDEAVPMAASEEIIEDSATPLAAAPADAAKAADDAKAAANEGTWSLVNMICLALTALMTIVTLLSRTHAGRRFMKVLSVIPAAAAAIAFALTQNMAGSMIISDNWTVMMLMIAAVNAVIAAIAIRNITKEEGKDTAIA